MKSGTAIMTRVAARVVLWHKSLRFSAAHNIWRFDDF
jgi:hypothetical protein